MNRIKFRSPIATSNEIKSPNDLIDSGEKYNLFHEKYSFIWYERVEKEAVQLASVT